MFRLITSFFSLLLLLFIILPIVKIVSGLDGQILSSVLKDRQVFDSIFLTFRCAFWATIACLIFGLPLAFILARYNFPGKSFIQGIVDLPVMIPHTAAGIALLMVFGRRFLLGSFFEKFGLKFVGTELGISLAMAFVSLPFLVNAARDGFLAIDPRMEMVARTLGANPFQVFFKITLPLAWRSIFSGAIMMWARGISEFGAVVILAYHPMVAPILIWERFEAYGLKYAKPVAVILVLICLLIFAVLRAVAEKRVTTKN